MECESVNENTMDSIDVTIFEDFYSLDITMPFTCELSKAVKTQQLDSTIIVSVPASPSKSMISPQITFPLPPNEPLQIPSELSKTSSQSESISVSQSPLSSKKPDQSALELSPNSPSEYSSLSPMKSIHLTPNSEYKSLHYIPSESASNISVASSPESPTLSMEFFTNALSISPKITPEAIPIASPKKTPVSFKSASKLEMSKSIGLQSSNKVTPETLTKSASASSVKSSKKISSGLKSTSKQNSLPKLLSNSPLVPHSGPGSIFSPTFSTNRTKPMPRNVSCRKRIIVDEPLIVFSPDVNAQTLKPSTLNRTNSSPSCSVDMKENKVPTKLPNRFESPNEIHRSLLLAQVSGRTNHSPIYTPFTSMVSRFKNLAIESPFVPADKVNVPNESCRKNEQHKTRVEKIKLISPLLRSPKLKIISAKHPLRSNSKVTNSIEKKSPTSAQYKAKTPVIQGSRIPVLKLN